MINPNHPFIEYVETIFWEKEHKPIAEQNKAYLKHLFPFIGLRAAQRQSITKQVLQEVPLQGMEAVETVFKVLINKEHREFHHAAIQLLAFYKKQWQPKTIHLMELGITTNSWWDTVDTVNAECLGHYFTKYPNEKAITTKWNESENMWLQRSSIIFQKSYKKATDVALLSKHILKVADSKEFFLQKAIGWALREYSKTDAAWVIEFVSQHKLAPLSKREALRLLA